VADSVQVVGLDAAAERVRRLDGTRVFYCYWIEDALPLMLIESVRPHDLDPELAFVCDDTFGGRLTAAALAQLGRRVLPLRVSDAALRIRDVQGILRGSGSVGLAVDGRGPYGRVGRSLVSLIRNAEALAMPVAARAFPARSLRLRARLSVPRRGCRLGLVCGEPLCLQHDAAPALQAALDRVRVEATALAAPG
jgi:hypothetical protein